MGAGPRPAGVVRMRSSLQLAVAVAMIVSCGSAQGLSLEFDGPELLSPGCQLDAWICGPGGGSGGYAFVLLSLEPGMTPMTGPGGNFTLPLAGLTRVVGRATYDSEKTCVPVTIPASPALIGMNVWLAAVVVRPGFAPLATYSVPFGPIIEDSIQ